MRTTLDLPDPIFRDLKIKAAQKGVTMKELLQTIVEKDLYDAKEPIFVRSPLPPPRVSEGPPIRSFTNAEMDEMFMQEDLERWGLVRKNPNEEGT